MTIDTIFAESGIRPRRSLRAIAYRGWLALRAYCLKRRTRHALLELTDDELRDIGITRTEAHREVRKSFYWD
ncbi:DUF1127 domain-containing protein [Shinella sp. CPCC 100929]|uniref:DUF1127 domain-containing protein n=1 Tax=Shinella lacus TaxID=2654216 RepID=A0ABT1R318_9HYPH|nr:DUF1127 domain-containing protein [Shinella lacus]MCQ4629558.1 DUF1127 domain-containing protein [Shinella lacus]